MLDPSAPIAFSMGAVTILVALVALFKNTRLGFALLISLFSAWWVTATGNDGAHTVFLFACFLISIISLGGTRFLLDIDLFEVNYIFALLCAIRMVVCNLHVWGLYSSELMWLMSMPFLLLQILLVAGSCIDGYSNKINTRIHDFRIDCYSFVSNKVGDK